MTRHRSVNKGKQKPLRVFNRPVPTPSNSHNQEEESVSRVEELSNLKSLLIDDPQAPEEDPKADASTSTTRHDRCQSSTAALHDELDSFRQRWKRELETKSLDPSRHGRSSSISNRREDGTSNANIDETKENKSKPGNLTAKEFYSAVSNPPDNPRDVYSLAKKLFLAGVELEQDEMHHESIRYYKQAMHLCPDIERQIFREQCEASLKSTGINDASKTPDGTKLAEGSGAEELPLYDRILLALHDNFETNQQSFSYCRPAQKPKPSSRHISQLPYDLMLQLFRYVIGQELDLASLESLGLVCRGFYLLSHDPSLWRSICYRTWGCEILIRQNQVGGDRANQINWRQLYIEKPRVNCDGIYISRTRYIRQGDVGFQDITYRPFHVVLYYRYIRFFPDKRVLVLTTNEEPEKIIPIFRHALRAKQFAPELTVLDGTYEFVDLNQLVIKAEKDITKERNQIQQQQTYNQRRQARFHWSRQTPLSQKFYSRFELKTLESRPFKNNILKWLEYTITTELETGLELTTFDLSSDTFPNLAFSRVKKFNLRLTEPLASH